MRTTVNLDDELLAQAITLCGVEDRGALLKEALRAFIERESARRLARLGGTEPQLQNIPRRHGHSFAQNRLVRTNICECGNANKGLTHDYPY